jgi:hypothetical protein
VESQQYIRCTARGDRGRVARITAARGLPFAFVKEIREGDLVETVGRVELEYKREVAAWFRESIERPDDALLAYAVTTDERETIRETERQGSVEAAKCVLRAKRRMTKRKPPAPDASIHAAGLAAFEVTHRVRARRRRARAQHDAKAPALADAELLPAGDPAIPFPAGAGQAG